MNFLPPFRSLHSSLFIVFHYLPSPFNTSIPSVAFHYLSSPFNTFRRLSLPFIAFHYLSSPPHLIVRPLSAPPFCPRLSPLSHHATASHSCFHPASSPPFVSHIRLSRTFTSSPFALFTPVVLRPLIYFLPLCFTLSHCFAPVFLLPGNLRKPVPGTAKGNVFLIFQRNFAKSP